MRETEPRPSLRISHIVYGRATDGGKRVTYLVDPKGSGTERAIPEEVVLRRWRRRKFPGYTFSGERLSSTVWRALSRMLGADPVAWAAGSTEQIRIAKEATARELAEHNLKAPAAETILALIGICGPQRLRRMLDRHNDPARAGHSGVPDLFLFARDARQSPTIARFVEVKKPEEAVSRDQTAEIEFLQDLGLHARVLRLIER